MNYINERNISELGTNWPELLSVIEEATCLIGEKAYSQPVKPYLRFLDPSNRIIAMPAYVGGQVNSAGIKWIASFPGNIQHSIKRAHSVIVLNDTETGKPTTLINTSLISGIRTAAVSGFVLKKYFEQNKLRSMNCGIIGFGPIGQLHAEMLQQCFGSSIDHLYIYDIKQPDEQVLARYNQSGNIIVCQSWQEVFDKSDVFITCTVSKERYVDASPRKGGIYLNVSLRDFHTSFLKSTDLVVVDSWEEICRENTDIEKAHLAFGLDRDNVLEIHELVRKNSLASLRDKSFMFNPMGMAVYDIAVAKYYHDLAIAHHSYLELQD